MPAKKIAALFYGVKKEKHEEWVGQLMVPTYTEVRVVIEIEELKKNVHSYIPYNPDGGPALAIITIGNIQFDDGSQLPPAVVLRQFAGYTWRRLR